MAKAMRLDKFLADMKQGTRSELKEYIRKGRVTVNGAVVKSADTKINPDTDKVTLDGATIGFASEEYFMLNKPQGVVSATEDNRYPTVIDLIEDAKRRDLFPVGRLDIDTEGLLLITNDGQLAHDLLSPKKHVDKVYKAIVSGKLPEDVIEQFAKGLTLEDGTPVKAAELQIVKNWTEEETEFSECILTIHEGKFHQVKRMFSVCGGEVVHLTRLSMGTLTLDKNLKLGEYRPLTKQEISDLKNIRPFKLKEFGEKILNEKKAVIFDLDGTLVDSMWMWKAIDIEYLGRYGYELPETLQKEIEGMSFSETAVYFKEKFQIPDSIDKIKQDWIDMSIDKYRYEVPYKKGARRFLQYLKKMGFKTGIATSNGTDMVDAVLESLDAKDFFDLVITACEVEHGKPAPDIYLKSAEILGIAPEDCVVFEDVPAGIQAGKNAGMCVCAVADTFSEDMIDEKKKYSDFFVESFEDLVQ